MILCKYVPSDAGSSIIRGKSIGFSQPVYFNDPFELAATYPAPTEHNPVSQFFDEIRTEGKRYIWRTQTAILSLTRSPLNPLMWANYSDGHRGFIIGFDAASSGFTEEEVNLVPAQYGSVIYLTVAGFSSGSPPGGVA